ncbi:uncharacterized protein BX663DRAFT_232570 [Cokeromyces recurvatus]|uniref:uncharacterized protein n=1 Tax=Cokeromyces recurvatus TaxID=90255 RepID=UPI00221F865E|nr:uncharacterized protein BX663DRAFT_232570 [Cokeromyces recurvatus]KAI7898672.1 hypothetical protein BX663DRAFT_232570 [Cokeromyces recurvatus]
MSTTSNSNNEDKNSIEITTHPSLYRDTVNGRCEQKADININCTSEKETEANNWDLYPQIIREIENEGTEKQVGHLHELEHNTVSRNK